MIDFLRPSRPQRIAWLRYLAAAIGMFFTMSPPAWAVITVKVNDAAIAPDGNAAVSVTVSGAGEQVNLAGFQFQLTPIGSPQGTLTFTEEDEAYLLDPNYLFVGHSLSASDGIPSSVGSVTGGGSGFLGGDGYSIASNVSVTSSVVLVRLRVHHNSLGHTVPQVDGEKFRVSLVPTSGDSSSFILGASSTGFADAFFGPDSFTSTSGIVTVDASLNVPEPPPLAVWTGFLLVALALGRARSGFLRRNVR